MEKLTHMYSGADCVELYFLLCWCVSVVGVPAEMKLIFLLQPVILHAFVVVYEIYVLWVCCGRLFSSVDKGLHCDLAVNETWQCYSTSSFTLLELETCLSEEVMCRWW